MMTAIIVDDEAHCVNRIRNLVTDYCPNEITILESCSDIDSAYEAIVRLSPRFIFLDVQIHEATGFDLLRRFETVDFEVVFATAYEKYAIEAFKFSAADYLLKPIDPDDFIAMIEKLKHRIAGNEAIKNLEIVVDNFHNLKHGKLTIPTLEGKEIFDIAGIIHCEAVGNYTLFNFRNRKPLKDSRTLKRYAEILTRHGFFRIHNSHLINLDDVKRFENGKNSFVVLKNNEKLPVSTRRKEDFLKRLAEISQ
jgi:two-component system LytT family response regulator